MYNDKIIKIEEIHEEEMYDIETDGNHLFYANDILTHNSSYNNLEADQSSISDSIGIYMTADSTFIISQTPDYKEQGKMRISFVKNRMSGKTRYFEIGYNYDYFRIEDKFRGDNDLTSGDVNQELSNMGLDKEIGAIINF